MLKQSNLENFVEMFVSGRVKGMALRYAKVDQLSDQLRILQFVVLQTYVMTTPVRMVAHV